MRRAQARVRYRWTPALSRLHPWLTPWNLGELRVSEWNAIVDEADRLHQDREGA